MKIVTIDTAQKAMPSAYKKALAWVTYHPRYIPSIHFDAIKSALELIDLLESKNDI